MSRHALDVVHRTDDSNAYRLPPRVQAAVCDAGLQLDDILYDSWEDGAWCVWFLCHRHRSLGTNACRQVLVGRCLEAKDVHDADGTHSVWTKGNAARYHAATNNNSFTHCQNQALSSEPATPVIVISTNVAATVSTPWGSLAHWSSSVLLLQDQPQSTTPGVVANEGIGASRSGTPPGTIAGIIVGILVILAIIAFALWFLRRERRRDGNRASLIPRWRASFLNRDSVVPPISRTSRLISHRTCC